MPDCKHMVIERVTEEEKGKHIGALRPWFKCECGELFFAHHNVSYTVPQGYKAFATSGDEPHGFPEG
jgi:hypothetical protein